MSAAWCWRPNRRTNLEHEPVERDYQCCCGAMTVKNGFITLTILTQAVVWLLNFLVGAYLLMYGFFWLIALPFFGIDSRVTIFSVGYLLLLVAMVVYLMAFVGYFAQFIYFLLAVFRPKPKHMQVFGILSVVLNVLMFGLIGLATLCAYIWMDSPQEHSFYESADKRLGRRFILLMFVIVLVIAATGWWLYVCWKYYVYLRDRELYLEEHPPQQFSLSPVHSQAGVYSLQPINRSQPPPYTKILISPDLPDTKH